jgi:hypothetical protein
MSQSYFRTAVLDDKETEVEVVIEVGSWGCSAHMGSMSYADHPAEGPEVEIVDCWLLSEANSPSAPRHILTDAERERIETEFCENPPEDDYDDRD